MRYKKSIFYHVKRFFVILLCSIVTFSSVSPKLVHAENNYGNNVVRDLVRSGAYYAGNLVGSASGIPGAGIVVGTLFGQGADYFMNPSSSGSDGNKYNYYINNGTTINNNQTYNYKVYNDYSSNPIINNNNSYNYSFYNPINNNFNYTNDFYYNSYYNTCYYNTTNNVDNSIDYYVTDNTTNVSYYIVNNDTGEEWYYEIYYELPDGRNSYNLTKKDIWGTYFVYDYDTYDSVAEDDGKTLGLWHLDGNLKDSSYWHNGDGSAYTANYVDGVYDGGKKLGTTDGDYISLKLNNVSLPSTYTLEWLQYFPNIAQTQATTNSGEYFIQRRDNGQVIPSSTARSYDDIYGIDYTNTIQKYDSQFGIENHYWEGFPKGSFLPMALVKSGGAYTLYCNGVKYGNSFSLSGLKNSGLEITSDSIKFFTRNVLISDSGWGSYTQASRVFVDLINNSRDYLYKTVQSRTRTLTNVFYNYNCIIDEVRLSKGALYTGNYSPATQPFITNTVLVPPDNPTDNLLCFKTNYSISNIRVGGVKPTYPTDGYVYVYLENDIVKSIQQYQSTGWYDIDGAIYKDKEWQELKDMDLTFLKVKEPSDGKEKATVTYKDGTSVFMKQTYEIGENASAVSCTNRHYMKKFTGWDIDDTADTVVFSAGKKFPVTSDMVLYAVWEDVSQDVTLTYMDGNTIYKEESFEKGDEVVVKDCMNDHYNETFKGWDVLKASSQVVYEAGDNFEIKKDTILYAVWEENTGGGDITSDVVITYMDGDKIYKKVPVDSSGSVVVSDCANEHQDLLFKGWATDGTTDNVSFFVGEEIVITESLTLYAVWENVSTDVTLTYIDGTEIYTKEVHEKGKKVTLQGCSNKHYNETFKGWDIDVSAGAVVYKAGEKIAMDEDLTLYAVWSSDGSGTDDPGSEDIDTSGILSLLKSVLSFIGNLFKTVLEEFNSLLGMASDAIRSLGDVLAEFSVFLSEIFGFVPSDFWSVIITGMTLIVLISVIKFIRG